ncbi:MAG TPA: phosphoribosylanthranilate isomerase [Syntrophales bacterium]|nr:phosphoribosylanthranilate isomerase [Syntrophales bacterium]
MVQIKICGITNIEDARAAAEAGADALGFVFHPASPRCVTPAQVKAIVRSLPATVCTVGVFVNRPSAEVLQIAESCGLDFVQLHGGESPDYCRRFPRERLIKAVSFQSEQDFAATAAYPVRAVLVDARDPDRLGGTGKTCDWDLARRFAARHPVILAGGLNADNVGAALEAVEPLAVDLSSGVEEAPGKKDHEKLHAVIAAVRQCDASSSAAERDPVFRKIPLQTPFSKGG